MDITASSARDKSVDRHQQLYDAEMDKALETFSDEKIEKAIQDACSRGERNCTLLMQTDYRLATVSMTWSRLSVMPSSTALNRRIKKVLKEFRKKGFHARWSFGPGDSEIQIHLAIPPWIECSYQAELHIRW